jgi:hypothetical protein
VTAAEHAILKALAVGDRAAARVLLGRRIQDREQPAPADTDKTGA